MPTMRSVGMHPPLRDRLASFGSSVPSAQSPCYPRQQQQQQHLPIRTPQALLSRDPSQVAAGLGLPLPAVLNLRGAVADAVAMTEEGGHGRSAAAVVAKVSDAMRQVGGRLTTRKRRCCGGGVGIDAGAGVGGGETLPGGEEEENETEEEERLPLFHRRRPPPVIVGALTALDMCVHSALVAETSAPLSTGSARLDSLLAPSADLADGGPATRFYHSSVVPVAAGGRSDDRGGGGNDGAAAHFGPERAPFQAGIRNGYVTEVYGPPSSGKTQLALTLAANAAISGGWTVQYLAGGGGSGTVLPLARRLKVLCASRLSRASRSGNGNGNGSAPGPSPSSLSRGEAQAALVRALERVVFSTIQDGQRALAVLAGIERKALLASPSHPPPSSGEGGAIAMDNDTAGRNNVLIVLDSASGCLSSDLHADGDGDIGTALVNDVGLTLRRMARTIGRNGGRCAVFVVNGTVKPSPPPPGAAPLSRSLLRHKPALGTGWRAADVLLHLDAVGDDCPADGEWEANRTTTSQQRPDGGRQAVPGLVTSTMRTIRATLVKHCSKSVSYRKEVDAISAKFGITADGIVDA